MAPFAEQLQQALVFDGQQGRGLPGRGSQGRHPGAECGQRVPGREADDGAGRGFGGNPISMVNGDVAPALEDSGVVAGRFLALGNLGGIVAGLVDECNATYFISFSITIS